MRLSNWTFHDRPLIKQEHHGRWTRYPTNPLGPSSRMNAIHAIRSRIVEAKTRSCRYAQQANDSSTRPDSTSGHEEPPAPAAMLKDTGDGNTQYVRIDVHD